MKTLAWGHSLTWYGLDDLLGKFGTDHAPTREQYHDIVHRRRSLDPTRRLMLAVLEDGLRRHCQLACRAAAAGTVLRPKSAVEYAELREWLKSPLNGLFSFAGICETLGLNADAVRGRVLDTCSEPLRIERSSVKSGASQRLAVRKKRAA